jgi:hypothetical protein
MAKIHGHFIEDIAKIFHVVGLFKFYNPSGYYMPRENNPVDFVYIVSSKETTGRHRGCVARENKILIIGLIHHYLFTHFLGIYY